MKIADSGVASPRWEPQTAVLVGNISEHRFFDHRFFDFIKVIHHIINSSREFGGEK